MGAAICAIFWACLERFNMPAAAGNEEDFTAPAIPTIQTQHTAASNLININVMT